MPCLMTTRSATKKSTRKKQQQKNATKTKFQGKNSIS